MKSNNLFKFVLSVILIIVAFQYSYSEDVLIVLSSNIKPYNSCYEGYKDVSKRSHSKIYLPKSEHGYKQFIQKIRKQKPKVIFAIGTKAFNVVSSNITDIPIVFAMVLNPKCNTLNKNITGITMNIDLDVRMEYLKKILPNVKNVGVILSNATKEIYLEKIESIENKSDYKFYKLFCSTDSELMNNLNTLEGKVGCILLFPDPLLLKDANFSVLLMFSFKNNIPLIGVSPKYVKMGALYGLYSEYSYSGIQASQVVDRIISGYEASKIPIEDIKKPYLVFNKKISRKMNLKIDAEIINSAKKIFE